MGGTPIQSQWGVPIQSRWGYPLLARWGTPHWEGWGVPPCWEGYRYPSWEGLGTPLHQLDVNRLKILLSLIFRMRTVTMSHKSNPFSTEPQKPSIRLYSYSITSIMVQDLFRRKYQFQFNRLTSKPTNNPPDKSSC